MPHDPELTAETRGWLVRAYRDLASGRVLLAAQVSLTGNATFHAQQAVEKAMKGFLTWHSRVFRKTHNLTELGEMCVRLDASLEPLLRRAAELTDMPGNSDIPAIRPSRYVKKLRMLSSAARRCMMQCSRDCLRRFGRDSHQRGPSGIGGEQV